jgi:hypothetical protein
VGIQLSFSAAQRYNTSPKSYYLHYVLRLRPKDLSSALFFGSAIDLAVNYMLQTKKDGKEIYLDIAQGIFSDAWTWGEINSVTVNLSEPGVIKYSKADYDESILTDDDKKDLETRGEDPSWISLKRKGFMILEAYRDQILPRIKEVKFVQKDIKLENDSGDSFIGFVDFCAVWEDGRTIIFDNKTSSIKYADDSAGISEQLATYFEATKEELKVDAVGFIVIPKKMRKQKLPLVPIEVVIGEINEKIVNDTFLMYDDVLEGIKAEKFECSRNDPKGCCSAPWGCGYKTYCMSGGKDTTGLVLHTKKAQNV